MRLSIRNPADFWSGLLFVAVASAFLWIARNYDFGSPLRMGPSFFPVVLSVALAGVGLIALLRSFAVEGDKLGGFTVKGLLLVTLGSLLFGILIERAGIVVAVSAITLVSAYASVKFTWKQGLIMAALLSVFCALVFVYGLGVPMPILGSWFVD
ncbi:Tripartite tricarboxylate transporter TctB family protein [Bradyrhizobium sp. Rc3b]|uniref:tripartite tricarboxylate transporter TctB family protein n=1 Tax=Bradyrhizobium sp. Rc3b TaxID=1855322 RepID=UPI0008F2796A|nr:tripartite tricarboxylate transporter TctB family protein [Bradyrhizobium sp. Rc3b]SFN83232.1 Tripartite tricarboxylate transporter TctB family protein [Bradyrhizobium sp. Rc3b]